MGAQEALRELDPSPLLAEDPPARLAVTGMCLSLEQRVILDDVTFRVNAGEIFGILGPNGAGKTSLMRCLTGLMRPDRGTLWIDGVALGPRERTLRAQLGVVFQEPSLDGKLTALENLRLGAALFGVKPEEARQRAHDLLVFMELEDRARDLTCKLSGGMRRRLEIARALIHRPAVLILDEPTSGLDMHALERTWQRIGAVRRLQKLTVLLSTHRPEEAAHCDRLLVMDRGHVVACDTPKALMGRLCGDVITLETEEPDHVATLLRDEMQITAHRRGDALLFESEAAHELIPRLVEAFPAGSFRSVSMRAPTLADAFFKLTGRVLHDDPETPR